MTVTCVDDAPGAVADAATVSEDAAATAVDVLGNDANADGGPLAIASATDPPGGTVVLTPPGPGPYSGLTYQPDANYCNTQSGGTPDTFQYTLTPGGASTTVSMTVTCVNDPPVVDLDADDNQGVAGHDVARTFPEGDPAVTVADADATITDVDSATLTTLTVTLTNLLDATFEVLDVNLTGADPAFTKSYDTTTTPGTGVLTITASPAQPVVDVQTLLRLVTYVNTAEDPDTTARVIEVVAHDGTDASTPAAVSTIAIVAADDAPVAVNDSATVAEDAAATAVPVLANDTDADGGPMSVGSVTQPANGTVVITGGGTGVTYQPTANYCNSVSGVPDTFTYTLTPGGSTATVSVTVTCQDDAPTAVADAATVSEDAAATAIPVLGNDVNADGGPMGILSASAPANGTVAITGGGTGLTYQPDAQVPATACQAYQTRSATR